MRPTHPPDVENPNTSSLMVVGFDARGDAVETGPTFTGMAAAYLIVAVAIFVAAAFDVYAVLPVLEKLFGYG